MKRITFFALVLLAVSFVQAAEWQTGKIIRNPGKPGKGHFLRTRSLDCGGMPKAIGCGHTNLLSKTKDLRVRGRTPTCTAKKGMRVMQLIGTVGQESLFADNHSTWNGKAS